MIIKYGTRDKNIDITSICIEKLCTNNIIRIPKEDSKRKEYFGQTTFGAVNSIFIIRGDAITEYRSNIEIEIDVSNECILCRIFNNTYRHRSNLTNLNIICVDAPVDMFSPTNKLEIIHSKINIKGGKIGGKNNVQIPHQKMLVEYLTGHEKVLEVGSNIGRSALIIAHILQEKKNYSLVSVECCKEHLYYLHANKSCHNLYFHIEESALSKRQLIMNASTRDIQISNTLINGYDYVNIIGFKDIQKKYNILFDTLVLDCGNMFYYILQDMPEILERIKLIIMTNDCNIDQKKYIDDCLLHNKFHLSCVEEKETNKNYYEVWKK